MKGPTIGLEATLNQIAGLASRWLSVPYVLFRVETVRASRPRALGLLDGWRESDITAALRLFRTEGPLIVPDLTEDSRFSPGPLVTGPLRLRFALVVPLKIGEGACRGFFGVFDKRPRHPGRLEIESLHDLARLAGRYLDESPLLAASTVMLDSGPQRYWQLLENATDAVYIHDLSGRFTEMNQALVNATGFSRRELLHMNVAELVTGEYQDTIDRIVHEQSGGALGSYDVSLRRRAGPPVPVRLSVRLLFEGGCPSAIVGLARDTRESTARLEAEEELESATAELTVMMTSLAEIHRLSTTRHSDFSELADDCLRTGCEILGASTAVLAERDPAGLRVIASHSTANLPARDLSEAAAEFLGRVISGQVTEVYQSDSCQQESDPRTPQGSTFLACTPVDAGEHGDGVLCFSGREFEPQAHPRARDLVECLAALLARSVSERRLEAARSDALTKLPNNYVFEESLLRMLHEAKQRRTRLAAAVIDIDRLGQFNEQFGYQAGDEALREIGGRLREALRPSDVVARVGADRFAVVLAEVADAGEAHRRITRLLAAGRRPARTGGPDAPLTVSIGFSLYPEDGEDANDLMRKADVALLAVKGRGRNDLQRYRSKMSVSDTKRVATDHQLERALENGELDLTYQPQIEINGTLSGLEVLLVWNRPDDGRWPAGQFVPAAEKSGLIIPIGAWVLREACRQCASWQAAHTAPLRIAVNVSAVQLERSDFVSMVLATLEQTDLPPDQLELEVTESAVMRDVTQSVNSMRELRDRGIRLAIDDFGTGYSSLSYLSRFPVHVLKIDRSFLHDPNSPEAVFPTIKAIVTLAHNLGLTVVGEGVEKLDQLELYEMAGCDRVQGHLFGRALTADAATQMLANRQSFCRLLTEE